MSNMSSPNVNPLTVMLVDDSSLMRSVLRDIVEFDKRMRVIIEAADGVDALRALEEVPVDVILLDLEMPRLDGLGFLAASRFCTAATIIVVSSLAQPGSHVVTQALELGAADVLSKPSGVLSPDLAAQQGVFLRQSIDRHGRCHASPLEQIS